MNLDQFNRILLQTLLVPVVALAVVAGILALQVRSAHTTVTRIQAADNTISATTRAQTLIVDQETGLRGYQITSDPAFLEPYNEASVPLASAFQQMRINVRAQGEDPHVVDDIVDAFETWQITYARPLIASIGPGGKTSDVALNLRGKQQMDSVRALTAALVKREDVRRAAEEDRWDHEFHHTLLALFLLVLAVGVFISVFTVSRLHRVTDAYQGTLDGLRRHARATFESEERLRTTLASIGDGVVVCDPAGKVEMLNPVAEQLMGVTLAEAYGRTLEDVFHIVNETTRELVETPVAKVMRLRQIVGLANHTILVRPDQSEIYIDDSAAPIYDRSGELTGVVMVFRDISDSRATQSALLSAEKLAVAGRMAATIAHEMHNPLDSVVNLLYLIRDEKNPQVSENYLNLAQGELDRMGQVSRAMLGLYRESKSPVRINVKETIESVLVLLDRQVKQAQVTITCELPEDLNIEGYPAEFRQVLTNLVVNAADASEPGAKLHVSASASRKGSSTGRGSVLIEIADNGSGIEADALHHVFEPFFTTKGERGTGLGLWVSRGIVEKHGGTITVRSTTDAATHGTTITLTLPRSAA